MAVSFLLVLGPWDHTSGIVIEAPKQQLPRSTCHRFEIWALTCFFRVLVGFKNMGPHFGMVYNGYMGVSRKKGPLNRAQYTMILTPNMVP